LLLQSPVAAVSAPGAESPQNFTLTLKNALQASASHVVIATGGGQNNHGHQLARSLGHRIAPCAPSLFAFRIKHSLLEGMQGISLPKIRISYPDAKLQQTGPAVFTHWGLSGPAALRLSAWGARAFKDVSYCCELKVNWLGEVSQEDARRLLERSKRDNARRALAATNPFELPRRFWERILQTTGAPRAIQWSQAQKRTLSLIAEALVQTSLNLSGKSMNKEEFVTCGGVSLKEIDFKTMQSRLRTGLHFAGEVLDVDGVTGGFNFQAAWTTAEIAAEAIARHKAQCPEPASK